MDNQRWSCAVCTFLNTSRVQHCVMCKYTKTPITPEIKENDNSWSCTGCTFVNDGNEITCNVCSKSRETLFLCPHCHATLSSLALFSEHVQLHDKISTGNNIPKMKNTSVPDNTIYKRKEPPAMGGSDTQTRTQGIMKALRSHYLNNAKKIKTFKLCSEVDHFGIGSMDKGFGCAYRNLQIMLSYLYTIPSLKASLFHGIGRFPDIPTIQDTLRGAWIAGFDPASARHFGFDISGTCAWIGTAEIASILSYFRLRVGIYEFRSITNVDYPEKAKSPFLPNYELVQWVFNYFSEASGFLPPLFLQHNGHSRTIVGVEQSSDGVIRLLLFDPSKNGYKLLEDAKQSKLYNLKFPVSHFVKKEYQIVVVLGATLLTDAQWQNAKMLKKTEANLIVV